MIEHKKALGVLEILAGILAVGYLDYVTGSELRVFPLYFLSLGRAAILFGRYPAIACSLAVTATWLIANYQAGMVYTKNSIWVLNTLTMFASFVFVALLISSLRAALLRERALSRNDPLTGLLNRRAFEELAAPLLSLCRRNNHPATLAYIDLDNFKRVNDTLGHQAGDRLLQDFAALISGGLRSADLLARVGGDEFIVLLPNADQERARAVLGMAHARLLDAATQYGDCSVGASIGAAAYTSVPGGITEMIKTADSLMYEVKTSGKGRVNVYRADSGDTDVPDRTQFEGQRKQASAGG